MHATEPPTHTHRLAASLRALVSKHPFLAGTFRGWLQVGGDVAVVVYMKKGGEKEFSASHIHVYIYIYILYYAHT